MTLPPGAKQFMGVLVIGAGAVAAAAWWALAPLGSDHVDPAAATSIAAHGSVADSSFASLSFDRTAFAAPLWLAPPPPPPPAPLPKAEPPPPPLKLQLLAIITDEFNASKTLRAVVYDPDTDRLLVLSEGQSAAGFTVTHISDSKIDLKGAAPHPPNSPTPPQSTRSLSLDDRSRSAATSLQDVLKGGTR